MTIDELAGIIARSFDDQNQRQGKFEQHVKEKLDQIEFSVSSQDRRISILEDRVRLLGQKAGMDFRKA